MKGFEAALLHEVERQWAPTAILSACSPAPNPCSSYGIETTPATTIARCSAPRSEHGVRKHAVHDVDLHLTLIEGIAATSLERTALDLAATEPFDDAVVAHHRVLAQHVTKDGLRRALDEWDPARGRRRIEAGGRPDGS